MPKVKVNYPESAKKIQKAWKDLHDKREKHMKEIRMEPTKMVEAKEDSYEIEPICIKNDHVVKHEPHKDHILKEGSGKLVLLSH